MGPPQIVDDPVHNKCSHHRRRQIGESRSLRWSSEAHLGVLMT
jgi:hypothetical protein